MAKSKKSAEQVVAQATPALKDLRVNKSGVNICNLRVGSRVMVTLLTDNEPVIRPGVVTECLYKGSLSPDKVFNHKKLRLQVLVDLGDRQTEDGSQQICYSHLSLRSKHVLVDRGVTHLASL